MGIYWYCFSCMEGKLLALPSMIFTYSNSLISGRVSVQSKVSHLDDNSSCWTRFVWESLQWWSDKSPTYIGIPLVKCPTYQGITVHGFSLKERSGILKNQNSTDWAQIENVRGSSCTFEMLSSLACKSRDLRSAVFKVALSLSINCCNSANRSSSFSGA